MEEKRIITHSFYDIGKITAIVNSVYKKDNASNITNTLLKLMQNDIKDVKNDN